MPVGKPDEYLHQNPSYAFVDSNSVRGGGRVVANLTELYALSTKTDQLKERVTEVYVIAETKKYELIDISNISNATGWQPLAQAVTSYRHEQITPATVWVINHNLGFKPNLSAFASDGSKVIGVETHPSVNQAIITYGSAPFAGEVYCS